MPLPVNQRAEKVLLEISSDLRQIQSQLFAAQDATAAKVNEGFQDHRRIALRKPVMEIATAALYVWVAKDPSKLMAALRMQDPKSALEFLTKISTAVNSLASDPSNMSAQANMQRLQSAHTEISSIQSSLVNAMQTHDAALQRLMNMEGANRQAG